MGRRSVDIFCCYVGGCESGRCVSVVERRRGAESDRVNGG